MLNNTPSISFLEHKNKKITIENLIKDILNLNVSDLKPLQRIKVDDKDLYVNTIEYSYDSNNNLVTEQTFTKIKSIVFLGFKKDVYKVVFKNPFNDTDNNYCTRKTCGNG
jgi:hypothetical protein